MKRIIFALGIISTFAFNDASNTLPKEKSTKDKVFCTILCKVTVDGVTYTASAGNWFSSCSRAASRCNRKLIKAQIHAE